MPGSGRSSGEGNSNPLQYSCLGNTKDRRAWWATVHGATKSQQKTLILLPQWLNQQRICLPCRRLGFDPWVRRFLWRWKWQPTPVLLAGESHGWRSLAGYSPWGHKESDMSEQLNHHTQVVRCYGFLRLR